MPCTWPTPSCRSGVAGHGAQGGCVCGGMWLGHCLMPYHPLPRPPVPLWLASCRPQLTPGLLWCWGSRPGLLYPILPSALLGLISVPQRRVMGTGQGPPDRKLTVTGLTETGLLGRQSPEDPWVTLWLDSWEGNTCQPLRSEHELS